MNISKKGIDLIKAYEGVRLKAYKPVSTEKEYTIGYGHYGVKSGTVITQAQADELLNKDLERFEKGVNDLVKVPVNQYQFDALVSFAFNCGLGNLQKSTLLKKVNAKDFKGASLEFKKWNKASGTVLNGLTKRRESEENLFNTPIKQSSKPPSKPISKPIVKPKPKPISKPVYHTIKRGDTLTEIAKRYNTTITKLGTINKLKSIHHIIIGQKLRVK